MQSGCDAAILIRPMDQSTYSLSSERTPHRINTLLSRTVRVDCQAVHTIMKLDSPEAGFWRNEQCL